jgi:hypothetical protein
MPQAPAVHPVSFDSASVVLVHLIVNQARPLTQNDLIVNLPDRCRCKAATQATGRLTIKSVDAFKK